MLIARIAVVTMATSVVQLHAQETIPEAVARGATNRGSTVPSGKPPTVEALLEATDLVVRGVVGPPRTYLSEDLRDVLSDYTLQNAQVLYERNAIPATRPGPPVPVTFTQLGGTLNVAGVTFSHVDGGLSPVPPGTEVIALLTRNADKFRIAGSFWGLFRVRGGLVFRLAKNESFAQELEGRPVDQASNAIAAVAREVHGVRE